MFKTNSIEAAEGCWMGIFCGPDYFYKAILPLGRDIVEARIQARMILDTGTEKITPAELKYCFLTRETEMISKDS